MWVQCVNKALLPPARWLFCHYFQHSLSFLLSLMFWTGTASFLSLPMSVGCQDKRGALRDGSNAQSFVLFLHAMGNEPQSLSSLFFSSCWTWLCRTAPSTGWNWLPILILRFSMKYHLNCGLQLGSLSTNFKILFIQTKASVLLSLLQTQSVVPELVWVCFYTSVLYWKGDYYSCNYHGNNYHKVLIDQDRWVSTKG